MVVRSWGGAYLLWLLGNARLLRLYKRHIAPSVRIILTKLIVKGLNAMRLPLERKESDCLKLIYSDKITGEETAEVVIPDVCGDAGKVLDVRGHALTLSKRAVGGSIAVNGEVDADVVVLAEDGSSVYCVPARLPFELGAQAPDADDSCLVTVYLERPSMDARLLNPRKLLIRARIRASVSCWRRDGFASWRGEEGGEARLCLLNRQAGHWMAADIAEKSFSVSDEYVLSAADAESKVISCEASVSVSEVKTVGAKLVFKATAETTALLLDPEGRLGCRTFETQFSQIIESACAQEEPRVYISPYLSSAEFVMVPDREEPVLAASFKLCVQAVCLVERQCSYIADAYSGAFPLELETQTLDLASAQFFGRQKLRLEGALEAEGCQPLYLLCSGVIPRQEGERTLFQAQIRGVGRRGDGELVPLELSLTGQSEAEASGIVSGLAWGSPSVTQNGVVSLDIFYELTEYSSERVEAICAIEADEENPIRREGGPAFTVLLAPGEELWDIAKKYGASMDDIRAINSLMGEFDPALRPLIIPRS